MANYVHATTLVLLLSVAAVSTQSPSQAAFEAASIKSNRSNGGATSLGFQAGGRFRSLNEPLWRLIGEAYASPLPLPRNRIIGGPAWLDSERFDVNAVAVGDPDQDQRRAMLQRLLAERFNLVTHTERRELPVFDLVMARDDRRLGPQLRASSVDCDRLRMSGNPLPSQPNGPNGEMPCVMTFGFGQLRGLGMSIEQLASVGLSRVAGRPVMDRTGLMGPFEWTLAWTPDNLPPRAAGTLPSQPVRVNGVDIDPDGPTLGTALQEQLGLRLAPTRGPISVIVIDRADRPTED
jgi:uncharacterized protein (TIGR03435 family)